MSKPEDLQQVLLATLILSPEEISKVIEIIAGRRVFSHKYQPLYDTLVQMWEKREHIDAVTLSERLTTKELKQSVSDAIPLAQSPHSVETYTKLLVEAHLKKSIAEIGGELSYLARQPEQDAFSLLEIAETKVFKLSNGFVRKNFVSAREAAKEAMDRINRAAAGELVGLSTGIPPLDQIVGGLANQELTILAGRPSVGKTALAIKIATMATKRGFGVGFFSLEMSTPMLVTRVLSEETGIDSFRINYGKVNDIELGYIEKAAGAIAKLPLFFEDNGGITVGEIRAKSRKLKMEHDISLIVVDYLQLITAHKRDTRDQEVAGITRALKGIAKELDLPVICLAQLNRMVESRADKKPILSDLRESGAIEQDADMVWFVYAPSNEVAFRDILVAKHRNGPIGETRVGFLQGVISW